MIIKTNIDCESRQWKYELSVTIVGGGGVGSTGSGGGGGVGCGGSGTGTDSTFGWLRSLTFRDSSIRSVSDFPCWNNSTR